MKRVAIFLLLIVSSIIGYDYFLIEKYGKYESISAVLIRASYEYPMIPFCVGIFIGFVCGHLFWQMKYNDVWIKKGIK